VNEPVANQLVGNDMTICVQSHGSTSWPVRYETNSYP
jgi:hypothetical protein